MFKKIQAFFISQLKKGITPRELALACAVGITGCVFPAIGATTFLCFGAAHFLRLNHPLVQAVNYATAPLQLLLFPIYLKLGAWICQVPAVSVNPEKVLDMIVETPSLFFADYGFAWLQAILAWTLTAPILFVAVNFLGRAVFNRTASKEIA